MIVLYEWGFGGSKGMIVKYRGPAIHKQGVYAAVSGDDGQPPEIVDFNSLYKLAKDDA